MGNFSRFQLSILIASSSMQNYIQDVWVSKTFPISLQPVQKYVNCYFLWFSMEHQGLCFSTFPSSAYSIPIKIAFTLRTLHRLKYLVRTFVSSSSMVATAEMCSIYVDETIMILIQLKQWGKKNFDWNSYRTCGVQ